jgi:hypothetical protein
MRSRAVAAFVLAALTAGAAAGCGPSHGSSSGPGSQHSGGSPAAAPVAQCGKARTAAGVPVEIDVQKGSAGCGTALAVERAYTHAVASGKVADNGGAAVTIHGWVCQVFNTPKVLATGQASACHKNGTEILAILPTPSASSSP